MMKKHLLSLFAITFLLMFTSCSSDGNNSTIPNVPAEQRTFNLISSTQNQFIVYFEATSGYTHTFDYEEGDHTFTVRNGDKLTVVCKIGEAMLPTVGYRLSKDGVYEAGVTLYSSPNTTQYHGFRLMKTQQGDEQITIQF